ncbi:MAG: transposase [Sedimentisphaerales bacterium]|nr:transposase [Sedimentisphaerales bacterium]MBN2843769.1 transposase [Sedimentisphaerales bacterium]
MPRAKRRTSGGYFYHVLNRANGRLRIFKRPGDFAAFENILAEGQERFGMRICGYCIMGNHWHLLLWPVHDGELTSFMHWVTCTHTNRFHAAHKTTGMGHIYQGRFRSFPFQGGRHYLRVLRYIEANPVRASLVTDPGNWLWSSYHFHCGLKYDKPITICPSPVDLPDNWSEGVLPNSRSGILPDYLLQLK